MIGQHLVEMHVIPLPAEDHHAEAYDPAGYDLEAARNGSTLHRGRYFFWIGVGSLRRFAWLHDRFQGQKRLSSGMCLQPFGEILVGISPRPLGLRQGSCPGPGVSAAVLFMPCG